jgi:transmembrane sensor
VSEAKSNALAANATGIEEQAADWLERSICEGLNAEARVSLDMWLTESPAHMVAYLRLNAAWDRTSRLAALRPVPHKMAVAVRTKRRAAGIAAAFITAVLLGAATLLLLPASDEKTYATALGKRETINLADGSRIELNTGTVLRVTDDAAGRTAWLDRGEAYFEIVHNAKHPFQVVADGRRVTDLGTKFLVRRYTASIEVALLEGRARFDAPVRAGRAQSALLVPGDVAVSASGSLAVTRKPARQLSDELGWRRGVLVFDNVTLADAAFQFNRYNSGKLVITDPAAARLAIYGTFRTGDVERFARVAQDVFGLRISHLGEQIVISR